MNVTLEIKAPDLAAAINNLAAAIAGRTGEAVAGVNGGTAEPEKQKPARSAAKPSPKTEPSTPDTGEAKQEPTLGATDLAPENEASASEQPETGDAAKLAYADVKKAVFNVSTKKGRDAVVKLLTDFGVDVDAGQKADVIDEKRWPEFISAAERVVAE